MLEASKSDHSENKEKNKKMCPNEELKIDSSVEENEIQELRTGFLRN